MNEYFALSDDEFVRGEVPMTKSEIRTLLFAKLGLTEESVLVDVGAGTGSISVAAALKAAHVYAIDYKEAACKLVAENSRRFGLDNVTILEGYACEMLEQISVPFDRVVIGGSGGELREILSLVYAKISRGGIIAVTAITLKTLSSVLSFCAERMIEGYEILSVSIAKNTYTVEPTMMQGANPIYIITFRRA